METHKPTINIRIYASTWKKIKRLFPPKKDESIAVYMQRIIHAWDKGEILNEVNEEIYKLL